MGFAMRILTPAAAVASLAVSLAAQPPEALVIEDFVTMPITGSPAGAGNLGELARINVMREEPGGTGRGVPPPLR